MSRYNMAGTIQVELTEQKVQEIIAEASAYLRQERERFFPQGVPLTGELRGAVATYFSSALLDSIRTVTLKGIRLSTPSLYDEAKAMGFESFPEFRYMDSLTYIDVIVFHEQIAPRRLFHALVHAAQMVLLGFHRYVESYVRGAVKGGSWLLIPLEDQAFKLEARFAMPTPEVFSVEGEIRRWAKEDRYP